MKQTISVTKQWQVHLPRSIRQELGLAIPTSVDIEAKEGKIIITPRADSILEDAGRYARYAAQKDIDLDTVRDKIDYSDL